MRRQRHFKLYHYFQRLSLRSHYLILISSMWLRGSIVQKFQPPGIWTCVGDSQSNFKTISFSLVLIITHGRIGLAPNWKQYHHIWYNIIYKAFRVRANSNIFAAVIDLSSEILLDLGAVQVILHPAFCPMSCFD